MLFRSQRCADGGDDGDEQEDRKVDDPGGDKIAERRQQTGRDAPGEHLPVGRQMAIDGNERRAGHHRDQRQQEPISDDWIIHASPRQPANEFRNRPTIAGRVPRRHSCAEAGHPSRLASVEHVVAEVLHLEDRGVRPARGCLVQMDVDHFADDDVVVALLDDRELYSGFETVGNVYVNYVIGFGMLDAAVERVLAALSEMQ